MLRRLIKRVLGLEGRDKKGGDPGAQAGRSGSGAPGAPPPAPAPEPEEDNAAHLSRIECGAQEVKERLGAGEPVLLLDVREPHETAGGIIPGARVIPLRSLPDRWQELKDANEVVCYCAVGARSLQAAAFLRERGIINATSMDGGISEWMHLGGKVQMPDGSLR